MFNKRFLGFSKWYIDWSRDTASQADSNSVILNDFKFAEVSTVRKSEDVATVLNRGL